MFAKDCLKTPLEALRVMARQVRRRLHISADGRYATIDSISSSGKRSMVGGGYQRRSRGNVYV